jgi:prepilin-type N-terminal cleavage/methylation domain-containing protein
MYHTLDMRWTVPARRGFTLIELMIVVAIIGILAAIAIPKFASLIRHSGEGTSKGNLATIRSAISIYYSDMEGTYPADMASLTIAGKYLTVIPPAKSPYYHTDSSLIEYAAAGNGSDAGGWQYNNFVNAPNLGTVWVNCIHTDSMGTQWTSY